MTTFQPGDRITVYQYTHRHPTPQQIEECGRNPWVLPPGPHYNQLQWWGDWPIVILSIEGSWARVTCTEFTPELQQEGVRVPLSHCELVERGHGLPELKPPCNVIAIDPNVVPITSRRGKRKAVVGQRKLL
jgi:hypothetical protein